MANNCKYLKKVLLGEHIFVIRKYLYYKVNTRYSNADALLTTETATIISTALLSIVIGL